jgi:hypothetical protein
MNGAKIAMFMFLWAAVILGLLMLIMYLIS